MPLNEHFWENISKRCVLLPKKVWYSMSRKISKIIKLTCVTSKSSGRKQIVQSVNSRHEVAFGLWMTEHIHFQISNDTSRTEKFKGKQYERKKRRAFQNIRRLLLQKILLLVLSQISQGNCGYQFNTLLRIRQNAICYVNLSSTRVFFRNRSKINFTF